MKRFSRCVLILILVAIVSGAAGYVYENKKIIPMYESTTQLYVVPGEENEASIRASNGGLKEDFTIIFKSNVVISASQRIAGTSEDIAQYLTVTSPANSNIVEIKCTNPDQNTAKKYVDAVASTAIKTTSIIPVKSIQILSEGTSSGVSFKPDLYKKTLSIAGAASAICVFIEIIVCLFISAFKSKEDEFNHEYEYERRFGHMDYIDDKPQFIETHKDKAGHFELSGSAGENKEHLQAKGQLETDGLRNIADTVEEEEDILAKLEHEVSDYFNDDDNDESEKNTRRRKHIKKSDDSYAGDEPVNEPDEQEGISPKSASEDEALDDTYPEEMITDEYEADENEADESETDVNEADESETDVNEADESETDTNVTEDKKLNEDASGKAISVVDELSDEEWKNIEIEDQAAAAIDEEESVKQALKEAEQTLSSGVSDIQIQEASKKNYRIIGTIKR